MARRRWPWDVLGIDPTGDKAAIRSAYAVRLKAMDVDRDIQGFAELRSSRDQALRDAAYAAEADDIDPLADAGGDFAGELDSDYSALPDDADADDDADDDVDWDQDWDFDEAYLDGDGPGGRYHGPQWGSGEQASSNENTAYQQLGGLLFPNGEQSDEGFTFEENEAAQAALTALLTEAKAGDLGQEQAIDLWLGEMLAQGWPRSAPLVDQAADSFGWLDQSGEISERPALQFLNVRLRGMLFLAKVEQADHPLHKYWEELKRPGKRGLLDRFRIKREGIEMLLGGIRSRYPEVESYLDHERVASWEKPAPGWVAWIVQRVFIFIVVIQLLALCGRTFESNDLPDAEVDQVVAEAFGAGVTMAQVEAADPKLADLIHANIEFDAEAGDALPAIEDGMVVRMREMAVIAVHDAPKADLLEIMKVRRDLLETAQSSGTPACVAYLKTARLPENFAIPEDVRVKERALAWRLAQAKLLDPNWAGQKGKTLPLPPWVGPGVVERTGLPMARINAVLRGEETIDFCAVRIALIDTLLSRPDDASEELLRFM